MLNQNFSDWSKSGETAFGRYLELHKIQSEASKKIIQDYLGFAADNMNNANEFLEKAGNIKNPEDFYKFQVQLMSKQAAHMMNCAQNIFKIYQEMFENFLKEIEAVAGPGLKAAEKTKK